MPPRGGSPAGDSAAMVMKEWILRVRFEKGVERRSFPHSQEKMQPFGACGGRTGTGLEIRGRVRRGLVGWESSCVGGC
jgi:hypothetical protein